MILMVATALGAAAYEEQCATPPHHSTFPPVGLTDEETGNWFRDHAPAIPPRMALTCGEIKSLRLVCRSTSTPSTRRLLDGVDAGSSPLDGSQRGYVIARVAPELVTRDLAA
jgi:hypothetical protein